MSLKDPKIPYYKYEPRTWEKLQITEIQELTEEIFNKKIVPTQNMKLSEGTGKFQKISSKIQRLLIQMNETWDHPQENFSIVNDLNDLNKNISHNISKKTADHEIIIHNELNSTTEGSMQIELTPQLTTKFYIDEKKERIKMSFEYPKKTHFYGLGERYWGLDKEGRRFVCFNTDNDNPGYKKEPNYQSHPYILINIPSEIKSKQWVAIFSHRPEMTYFDLGQTKQNTAEIEVFSPIGDFYFISGENPFEILEIYTALTGRMPLPPLWALGMHQCRWGYKSSEDIRKITGEYRRRKIPCDGIWYDIDYMDEWAIFTWHPERFEDYKELNQELHNQKWKIVTIIDPGMALKSNYKPVIDGIYKNYFAFKGDIKAGTLGIYESPVWPLSALFPDFYRTEVKKWFADLNRDFVLDGAVDGIWNDMNELVCFKSPDRLTWPQMLHKNDNGELLQHYHVHNTYALEECKATFMGLKEAYPHRRPFVLTRAGFPGIQQYSAIWTGDNSSLFQEIWQSIPMMASLGLSGQSFIGADIGGFSGTCYPPLLIRWSQLGVFYPFARNHSSGGIQEPWAYELLMPSSVAIIKTYYRFRYLLMPYFYSQFWFASQTGFPIWRPLVAQFPEDPLVKTLDTEILIGSNILLAPVFEEPDENEDSDEVEFLPDEREIYLPISPTTQYWYDLWAQKFVPAGTSIKAKVPIDQIPIFIRNNAIIPCRFPEESSNPESPDPLILYIFTNIDSPIDSDQEIPPYEKNQLYIDAGDDYQYKTKEEYNLYDYNIKVSGSELNFEISELNLNYQKGIINSTIIFFHGINKAPKSVLINGKIINSAQFQSNVPLFIPQAWNCLEEKEDLKIPQINTYEYNSESTALILNIEIIKKDTHFTKMNIKF